MQVEWTGNRGAAGNHVELKAGEVSLFSTPVDDGMFSSSLFLRLIDSKQFVFDHP
jgi:hypothetical protein